MLKIKVFVKIRAENFYDLRFFSKTYFPKGTTFAKVFLSNRKKYFEKKTFKTSKTLKNEVSSKNNIKIMKFMKNSPLFRAENK